MPNKEILINEIKGLCDFLKPILEKHISTLSLKRSQLVRKDHYGIELSNEWENEVDYFILNVLYNRDIDKFNEIKSRGTFKTYYGRLIYIINYIAKNSSEKKSLKATDWNALSPSDFEHYCAEELKNAGWTAQTTRKSWDQGIDIIATSKIIKLVVQCKKYKNQVSNKAVQEIIAGREFEKAQFAAVISTGTYTKSAEQLAASAKVILLHPKLIKTKLCVNKFDKNSDYKLSEHSFCFIDISTIFLTIPEKLAEYEIENWYISKKTEYDGRTETDIDLVNKAIHIIYSTNNASTSLIQHDLNVSYDRAVRIMNTLEKRGIIGPDRGSQPRKILMNLGGTNAMC